MSRCFPYPPPGYTLSRASKEALIESIKLQKEREKAKEQKKKEKRRRKEEEGKEKEKSNETNEKTDLYSKKRLKEGERKSKRKVTNEKTDLKSKIDFLNGQLGQNILANSEQLEKSSLTEEHEQPIHLHAPSTSSESTENSNKRKRQSSPNGNRGHGTIIRIRLPKKQNVSDTSISEQQLCSTSGRSDVPLLRNQPQNFCILSEKTRDHDQRGVSYRTDGNKCSAARKSELLAPTKTITPPGPEATKGSKKSSDSVQYQNLIENCVRPLQDAPKTAAETGTPLGPKAIKDSKRSTGLAQYENLIENWVPPSLQDTRFGPEDLGWLFSGKDLSQKKQKFENDNVFCSSSSLLGQPRAQLLPGVNVYALPFTVPY